MEYDTNEGDGEKKGEVLEVILKFQEKIIMEEE